jgi:hypothetical protein
MANGLFTKGWIIHALKRFGDKVINEVVMGHRARVEQTDVYFVVSNEAAGDERIS